MAVRARLVPPPLPPAKEWPWHNLEWGTISVSEMTNLDRRMEAETYLSSGFGLRRAIERRSGGWVPLGDLARFWAPPRIKQVFVDPSEGVPYLNTSQVFEVRPSPRKWLAMEKTSKAASRLARQGTILVMASATPGRSTLVTAAHENAILSHHFMRVEPKESHVSGWLYGFLRSPQGFAMLSGSQYASIIRHIEPHHVAALPIPTVDSAVAQDFDGRVAQILALRNDAFRYAEEADARFADAVGPVQSSESEDGFVVQASVLSQGRRRLDAAFHTPRATGIVAKFRRYDRLRDVASRVWWMPRFKRFYGDGGVPYISADELFTINPQGSRRILVRPDDSHQDYYVRAGWLLMACSGQVYGLNGAVTMATARHENVFFSHDLIRIIPHESRIRAGYLMVALTHRTHGRPLLIRAAYGTSIPHLDPGDVADFPIVRLPPKVESAIADLAEASVEARDEADAIERKLSADAGELVRRFIAGR